jgi:outer membrane protein insertion porin family
LPLKTTLNLRGQIGVITTYGGKSWKDIPVYELFYVGGASTVRGFEYGWAGPVDPVTETPLGATKMWAINTELIFPLSREIGLRGAVFFDMGKGFTQWRKAFPPKFGAGPGIRWFSPFGPINIDLGFNLNPQKGEKGFVIDFNAGSTF